MIKNKNMNQFILKHINMMNFELNSNRREEFYFFCTALLFSWNQLYAQGTCASCALHGSSSCGRTDLLLLCGIPHLCPAGFEVLGQRLLDLGEHGQWR